MTDLLAGAALARRAELVLTVPLASALGVRLLDPARPEVGAEFRVTGLADNGAGGVHAAALGAVLEIAAYLALASHLTVDEHALTHASAVQLIAAAGAGDVIAVRGLVDRRTRRTAFVSATAACVAASTPPVLIARAQLTKTIVPLVHDPNREGADLVVGCVTG